MNDGSRKYLYDVKNDSYCEVEDYGSRFEQIFEPKDISSEHSLSGYVPTYLVSADTYVSYILDTENKKGDEQLKYGDLVILREIDGKIERFRPFSDGSN